MSATMQLNRRRIQKSIAATKEQQKKKVFSQKQARAIKAISGQSSELQLKHFRYAGFTNPVSSTPLILSLIDVGVGDTDLLREGDQLTLKSIHLRGDFLRGDTYNIIRLIIFQWKGDSTPLAADVFEDTSSAGALLYCPIRKDTRQLLNCLRDDMYYVNSTQNENQLYKYYINKGFTRKIVYQGGTTIASNKIYLAAVSDSTVASHPNLAYYSNINFTSS